MRHYDKLSMIGQFTQEKGKEHHKNGISAIFDHNPKNNRATHSTPALQVLGSTLLNTTQVLKTWITTQFACY